jgi:hypothetical protein
VRGPVINHPARASHQRARDRSLASTRERADCRASRRASADDGRRVSERAFSHYDAAPRAVTPPRISPGDHLLNLSLPRLRGNNFTSREEHYQTRKYCIEFHQPPMVHAAAQCQR